MGRKKEKLYLAYGSNMNQTQMAFRCPTAKVVGTSELKGYELLFKGGRRGAVATVEPKEMLQVELEGKEVSVMGYVMTPGHEFGIPSDGYADVIWEGYEQCGLDTKPLEDAINKAYAMAFQQEQGLAEPGCQGLYGSGGMKPME